MPVSSRRPILFAPAITAVILGMGLLAPSTAYAECGNYIVYTNPAHKPLDAPPMGEHRVPVGCQGPNCSQVPPAVPMPQAPLTVRILADEPLVAAGGDALIAPSATPFSFDPPAGHVIGRPTDVFHPPR